MLFCPRLPPRALTSLVSDVLMAGGGDRAVALAVEGIVDEAVVLKLFQEASIVPGSSYICEGVGNLRRRLRGFNAGARHSPWFVLCDLDQKKCAPGLRYSFLGDAQAGGMQFRVAVREIEAWLLADRETFADFLGVSAKLIPQGPEQVDDPKRAVIDLARKSDKKEIRRGIVPSGTSGRRVGATYTAEVSRYVRERWSPTRASIAAPSLARAFMRCQTFSRRGSWS